MPTITSPLPLPQLLKLLSDETRLRVLGLLASAELGVGELAEALQVPGPRLANHLRLLREAGLVLDRREGAWRFVRLNKRGGIPEDLWAVVHAHLALSEAFEVDQQRLKEVFERRRARSRSFFERMAGVWDDVGSAFATGRGRLETLGALAGTGLKVADVGAGTGYLSAPLVGLVGQLILIDHSPAMLERARAKLPEAAATQVEVREGELDRLPLADGEVDAVLAGMVLHHAPDPADFVAEAARVLRPGGFLIVQDLLPHKESWLREELADLRLGIDPGELSVQMRRCGLQPDLLRDLDDHYCPTSKDGERPELPMFLLRGLKAPERGRDPSDPAGPREVALPAGSDESSSSRG